jgi:hypothetical protein
VLLAVPCEGPCRRRIVILAAPFEGPCMVVL